MRSLGHIGRETIVHYTKNAVEVYYNRQRIALHPRNGSKGSYNTNMDHLGGTLRHYNDWSPEFFRDKAIVHGNNVAKCVERIIAGLDCPEIGYKRAMVVIKLHRAYGSRRLDNACKTFKRNPIKFWNWYSYLTEDRYQYEYHDKVDSLSGKGKFGI